MLKNNYIQVQLWLMFISLQDCVSDQDEEPRKYGLELGSLGWTKVGKKIVMENHNGLYTETKTHGNFVK